MIEIQDRHRDIVRAIEKRRRTAGQYAGDIEEFAGALAKIEADAKATERERCAQLLANECVRLVQTGGSREEAEILARESQRIRGNYPASLREAPLACEGGGK